MPKFSTGSFPSSNKNKALTHLKPQTQDTSVTSFQLMVDTKLKIAQVVLVFFFFPTFMPCVSSSIQSVAMATQRGYTRELEKLVYQATPYLMGGFCVECMQPL